MSGDRAQLGSQGATTGARIALAVAALLLVCVPGTGQSPTTPSPSPAPQEQPVQPAPPPPPDDVELAANLVTLTVVVRDESGRLVTNLIPADFVIYEDNTPREVDRFYRQGEVPLRLVMLFDTSVSVRDRIDFEKRAASRFFTRALRPGDQAALFSFSSKVRKVASLTDSAEVLARATETLRISGITALFGAIEGAAKYLEDEHGRRVIVLLSDGFDTVKPEAFASALTRAQMADVMVYAISPAGSDDDPRPNARVGAATLRRLADETGGVAFFPPVRTKQTEEAADLDEIFTRIIDELRGQYVFTYYSGAPRDDGRLRALRVEVKRPGLTATSRRGYYASRPAAKGAGTSNR